MHPHHRSLLAAAAAFLFAAACAQPEPTPMHAHHRPDDAPASQPSDHGHHNHDFSDASAWAGRFNDPARDAWQKPDEIVRLLDLAPGMTAADIGAGTGYFEPWLARAVGEGGAVLALDIEPKMIAFMQQAEPLKALPQVRPGLAKADDPGLADASVDRVLIVNTWHHIQERTAYARLLRKALKPDGRLVIVDFTLEAEHGPPAELRLKPEQIIAELQAANFVAEVAAETLPNQYVIIAHDDAW